MLLIKNVNKHCKKCNLQKSEGMGKPTLVDTVELSSHPTCMCVNPSQSSLWVAAGSGIYVIDTE